MIGYIPLTGRQAALLGGLAVGHLDALRLDPTRPVGSQHHQLRAGAARDAEELRRVLIRLGGLAARDGVISRD